MKQQNFLYLENEKMYPRVTHSPLYSSDFLKYFINIVEMFGFFTINGGLELF